MTTPAVDHVESAPLVAEPAIRLERRDDGVGVIRIDVPGESVNTLRGPFAAELEAAVAALQADSALRAVVVASGKPDGFVAGADIKELMAAKSAREVSELSRRGQAALGRLAALEKPVVAAIHGACLGGGLELALACHARVASTDEKTKLGLPEVQLGLLPALGGTQRLPRLVGTEAALDLILTGKQLDARRAQRLGLVDEVVPAAIVFDVAVKLALSRTAGPAAARGGAKRKAFAEALLVKNPLGRALFFEQAKKKTLAKTHGNYPAAERILEVVRLGLSRGMEAGLGAESAAFGELALGPEAHELMGLFFAQNELKKDSGVADPHTEPRKVRRVGVLGAGLMGAGIAYVTAVNAKLSVRLKDRDERSLGRGMAHLAELVGERARTRRMSPFERDREAARVTPTTSYDGFDGLDVVIEAVFEDLALKRSVLADVLANGGKNLIFASNTSSLPITQIAEGSVAVDRVVGMHYFSPVQKMPLLEVVTTAQTAPWVTATAVELGKKQGKTVIVVRDGPGFYTSRILGPYLNEATYLLSEGVPIEVIDAALVRFGFPVGPVTLLDEVGIDVGVKVGKILHEAFGARMAPPPGIERLVEDERFGKKNGRGFYDYGSQKRGEREVDRSVYAVLGVEPKADLAPSDAAERCVLALVNEAVHCLGEGILRSARDGDIGAVFGLGFPPFRGGPFRYVDGVGAAEIVRRLERHQKSHGDRFRPAPLLVELAQKSQTFHGKHSAG
ncbi:MAG TPA: fatty acid oxidation complex subunit alpha FadJ [Polyangiaceae bacterium]|nr:fatty acid oxidation complex subunit alpha FadJ [Polyangiaceae bacterium]